jgi:hypothetical protein
VRVLPRRPIGPMWTLGLTGPGSRMAEISASTRSAPRWPTLAAAAGAGLVLAAAVALWAHYGTAVFYEMILAGFAACF